MNKLLLLLTMSVLGLASCSESSSNEPEDKGKVEEDAGTGNFGGGASYGDGEIANPTLENAPFFRNIGVHDPSVLRDTDGTYYVFGSHLSTAKSDDLIGWTRVADGVDDNNPLFETYATEISEGIAWTDGYQGSWAADVIQLADGKYYFYYNHCAGNPEGNCVSRSYMGIAIADDIEGPYIHQQLILKTGHRAEDGNDIEGDAYTGNSDPNAIDPDVFFGKDDSLWMVYGSYSGGIFIKELDSATGVPLDNDGYGTKITGGFYSAIEGPFMLYSPESDYYYVFLSYAGYDQNGGYNVRVARSKTPEGPYLDAAGKDIIDASGGLDSIDQYGNKVLGGFNFKSGLGMSGNDYAYMAPGHGSAYYDEETGKHLMFFHTRFPTRGEQHEVRVHEMLMTEDDWLVVAPHRYTDIQGENIVDADDILGTYQYINHGYDSNKQVKESTYVTLDDQGKVSGAITGDYTLTDNKLTITTETGKVYKGVASWQWHEQEKLLTPTFVAQSDKGINIWGSKMPFVDYDSALTAILDGLEVPEATITDLSLPTEGILSASLTWSTSDAAVITSAGIISQGNSDQTVTLTVTVDLDGNSASKDFTVIVKSASETGLAAHYSFDNALTDNNGVYDAAQTTTSDPDVLGGYTAYVDGVNNQAFDFTGTVGLKLPNTLIMSNAYSVSFWAKPTELNQFTPMFFAAADTDSWLSVLPKSWDDQTMLWSNNNDTWFDGQTNTTIPVNQWTHITITNHQGEISFYIDGAVQYSGNNFPDLFSAEQGDLLLGVNYWDSPFTGQIDELKVFTKALDADEVDELYKEFN